MARKTETSYTAMADTVAQELHQLAQIAVRDYEPEVRAALQEDERNPARIEQLLDGMLDFCFDDDILRLYKDLCRHYYGFNPSAAVFYVHAYRETWDDEASAPTGRPPPCLRTIIMRGRVRSHSRNFRKNRDLSTIKSLS